ncbi:hypothetical protein FNV43_RR26410 [Rhamnella rubrinervis]|uniref:Uncharacterized protein n=1 Tax=Rhamnella rubrinervis TaxID=2594499 RepID=A0A8K0DMI8_9ROSA|nr:hypothetical protein FNV43_RR26410 [Rhamnella rubrinervis]
MATKQMPKKGNGKVLSSVGPHQTPLSYGEKCLRRLFLCFFMNGGVGEDPYKVPVKCQFPCSKLNSDHVLILYDHDLSCKKLQKNFGANWSSICNVSKASFDFILRLLVSRIQGSGKVKTGEEPDFSVEEADRFGSQLGVKEPDLGVD